MHFSLTEEQRLIVDTTREFVVNELYPHEAEIETTGRLRPELRDEIKRKAIGAGLYAANMPAEVGGAGLDTLTWILYERELGRANYALHWTCVARPSNILMACEGEQRERYLFPAIRGERSDCLAMTEPGAGSDLRGMKTRARREGDDFIINGTKRYITNARQADVFIVMARTVEGTRDASGISAFIVPAGTPGLSCGAADKKMGQDGSATSEVYFDEVRVPASALIGGREGGGFKTAMRGINHARLHVAVTCVGQAQRLMEEALSYTMNRRQFGQALAEFQLVQAQLLS